MHSAKCVYPVLAHQSADTAVTNIQTKLFQLFGHSRSAIADQTQAMLLPNMGQALKAGIGLVCSATAMAVAANPR